MVSQGENYLRRIRGAARCMGKLIDNMLQLARMGRTRLRKERIDVTAMANRHRLGCVFRLVTAATAKQPEHLQG